MADVLKSLNDLKCFPADENRSGRCWNRNAGLKYSRKTTFSSDGPVLSMLSVLNVLCSVCSVCCAQCSQCAAGAWPCVNREGLGGRGPPDFGLGVVGDRREGHGGSWTGREILLYLIMYVVQEVRSKVVTFEEKWNILPRSSCKYQFLPGKSIFVSEIAWKIKFFWKFAWKNRNCFAKLPEKLKFLENLPGKIENFLWNCLKESKFFGNLPGKIKFFTRSHDPQILNQIDASDVLCSVCWGQTEQTNAFRAMSFFRFRFIGFKVIIF